MAARKNGGGPKVSTLKCAPIDGLHEDFFENGAMTKTGKHAE